VISLTPVQRVAAIKQVLRITKGFEMSKLFARFVKDEAGATAIEYGLIAAGISLAIIAAVNGLGTNLNTKFTSINTSLK
jgi:pilus assembly protein Flp/PilA